MKVKVLSSTIIVSLIICGEKILIFYNKNTIESVCLIEQHVSA